MLSRGILAWSSSFMGSLAPIASPIASQHPLLLAACGPRHMAASSSTPPQPKAGPSHPQPHKARSIFRNSKKPSHIEMPTPATTRKPAILKPAPHQWRLCSPSYDPSQPPPSQHLPPYAPERAKRTNYRAIMHAYMPTSFHRNRHRRAWKHKMLVATNAWRRKHEHSAAAAAKQEEYAQAVELHVRREAAWRLWCRQNPGSVHRGMP